MNIELWNIKENISLFQGVWRESGPDVGRWMLLTHKGPREINYGSIVLVINSHKWVLRK